MKQPYWKNNKNKKNKKHSNLTIFTHISVCMLLVALVLALSCCAKKDAEEEPAVSDVTSEPVIVSLSDTSLEIGKGLTRTLTASGGAHFVYETSDEQVAKVDENGVVTGVGVGNCRITVSNEENSVAECDVQVKKTCYITIDDGPTKFTEAILDVLKEYDCKATFFVVNSEYLYTTKRMKEQGCAVGLHTYCHIFKYCYATQYSYYYGLETLSEMVEEYTGEKANLIRFPGGTNNTRGDALLMRRNLNGAFDLGYRVFDWTSTTGDSSPRGSKDFSIKNVQKTCIEDVEILLMHDRHFNVEALKTIIPYLREKGYIFATLDQYPEPSMHTTPQYSKKHPDIPSTSVSIALMNPHIQVGQNMLLFPSMTPHNSTDFVRWESSNPSVAKVSVNGNVTGVSPGEVDIYAITSSGQRGVRHMTIT